MLVLATTTVPSGTPLDNSITEYYLVRCLHQREPVSHTLRVIWSASPALVEDVLAEIELLVCARSILKGRKRFATGFADY